ncbi:MAG: galactokinase [Candidatus Riflebacteria bacterium]|nr:galactokinase [Candidatus Riflebacteria bacterium]
MDTFRIVELFQKKYGKQPRLFKAPGRVNLIGEHTDYNDGFVMPMAIDRWTIVAGTPREDSKVNVTSITLDKSVSFDLNKPGEPKRGEWYDYVEGVAQALLKSGATLRGADFIIDSNIPIGAGLSSSASIEVAIGFAFLVLSNLPIDRIKLALAGQNAEHNYVGMNCGIMDQFISTLGKKNHALLIDCRSLDYKTIKLELSDFLFVICDTRVKHKLSSSEYNIRRQECEKGVKILRKILPNIKALRDVTFSEFNCHANILPVNVQKRCKHVIQENLRTVQAAEAFSKGHLGMLKELMAASHRSLRDDYQVSCKELDVLVDLASFQNGVTGSRMTGGGFGGCTINLVNKSNVQEFKASICKEYFAQTQINPEIHVCEPSDGACEII